MATTFVFPAKSTRASRGALLSDPKLHASIRKTLRSHGVPADSVDDLLHDTLARARCANLPESDADATKYIHGIAVHLACDHRNYEADHLAVSFDECTCSPLTADPDGHELRDGVAKILARLHERFPRAYHFFEAMYVHGESSQEVARRTGVSDGYVRAGASEVRQTAQELFMQIGIGLALVLFFLGVGNELRDRMRPTPIPDVAHTPPQVDRHAPIPLETGVDLRDRGVSECQQGKWKACLDDLNEARKVDPDGEDATFRELRYQAEKRVTEGPLTPRPFVDTEKKP
jgi:DNA-directed RNA polymerase specialized sigma24 family protein